MKSINYCIVILLAVTFIISCSKKEDNDNQQIQISQEQVTESQEPEQSSNIQINPVPSQDVLALNPSEIVEILMKIGFTDSQIKEHAFDLRDALAKSGAVRIMIDNKAQAGLAVNGDEVLINSIKGRFIYNTKTGWVGSTWR